MQPELYLNINFYWTQMNIQAIKNNKVCDKINSGVSNQPQKGLEPCPLSCPHFSPTNRVRTESFIFGLQSESRGLQRSSHKWNVADTVSVTKNFHKKDHNLFQNWRERVSLLQYKLYLFSWLAFSFSVLVVFANTEPKVYLQYGYFWSSESIRSPNSIRF